MISTGARGDLEGALAGPRVPLPGDSRRARGSRSAWGLPYFRQHVHGAVGAAAADRRAGAGSRRCSMPSGSRASPPHHTEARGERRRRPPPQRQPRARSHLPEKELFDDIGVFEERRPSAAGVRRRRAAGATSPLRQVSRERISSRPTRELFLGFTSTLKENLGPSQDVANLETLGIAAHPAGVLHARHAHAPLPHPREPRGAGTSTPASRRPGADDVPARACTCRTGTLTVPQGEERGVDGSRRPPRLPRCTGRSGTAAPSRRPRASHAGHVGPATAPSTQRARRSRSAPTSTRSTTRSPGARKRRDGSADPAAGVHFLVFDPTSDEFGRGCAALWTASFPTGRRSRSSRGAEGQGFNSILRTAREGQNFLVPPRLHRAFPLSELRT